MDGLLSEIEPLYPTGPLSPDILPCSVLRNSHCSPIDPLFPVKPLTPDILPCSVLMNGPLSPIELYSLLEF